MQARVGRSGWSDEETRALMDAAHRARAAGRPLREVFDAAAFRTGRKPNSIRNYYYACSRMEEGARRALWRRRGRKPGRGDTDRAR